MKIKKMMAKWLDFPARKGWRREETEFLPAALEVVEKPPVPASRVVLWTLLLLIGCTLVWAVVGSLDEVAVAPGKLIPTGNVKIVQAEDKGVIKAICVKEGDLVKQGQLLIELDATIPAADLARIRKEVALYSLEMDRLSAEAANRPFTAKQYPELDERDAALQQMLYQTRQLEYQTRLSAAAANVKQNQVSLDNARSVYEKLLPLYEIAQERERKVAELVNLDAVAGFVLLDYRQKRLESEKELASQQKEIERLQWSLRQSEDTLANVDAEWLRGIHDKLQEDSKALQASREELKKAEEKNRLSAITSPVDGRVSQLAVHTVGGIVTAAEALLEVVPADTKLQLEAWVANKDIGFIQTGQAAEIKVETFNFQKYGTVPGEVIDISPDAVEDKEKGRIYRVVLALEEPSFRAGGRDVLLTPGMTATAEIKIRRKRVIEYFLDVFQQYRSEALRERS